MRRVGLSGWLLSLFGVAAVMGQGREGFDLNDRGLAAAGRGDQAAAERLYRQAMEVWRKMGPDYRAHLGTTEYNLGQSLCAQGRRGEALPLLEDAVQLLRGTVGVRHFNTLSALNYLAGLQLMLGDAERGEALFREALPIERELYPKDAQLGLTLGGLSTILVRQGKTAEALPLAEEELTIALAAEGEQSLHSALAYANVATVHKCAGRYDRAMPLFRKSLSIYDRLVGPDHPRTAGILMEIGLLEMEDGNYTLAERDMLRSLDIVGRSSAWTFEQWIGESNLGTLRLRQGKYDEAARRLTRSLELQEQAGIRAGRDLAGTLEALAKVREKQRRYDDARQLRDRAVMISSYR
jgi:tetratricopeptide (TPR) repeat protein